MQQHAVQEAIRDTVVAICGFYLELGKVKTKKASLVRLAFPI
jgi:hypothetical protein